MTPHKKVIGGTTSKGKDKTTAGDAAPNESTINSSQRASPLPLCKSRQSVPNLHNNMKTNFSDALRDKEQMRELQQKSDRKWEYMILYRDNILRG